MIKYICKLDVKVKSHVVLLLETDVTTFQPD